MSLPESRVAREGPFENPPVRGSALRTVLALVFVQLCFGAFPVLGKAALHEVSPLVLASFRAIFGAFFLSLFARVLAPEEAPIRGRERLRIMGLAILGIVANQLFFVTGLSRTTATNASLLVATTPIVTLGLALLMRREEVTTRRVLAIPLALLGVLLILDWHNIDFHESTFQGDLLVTTNSACYSLFLILSRDALKTRSAISFIAAAFRYGALPIVLFALPDLLRFDPRRITAQGWAAIAAVVIFATAIAYALNAWALARTKASTTAMFIYIQPLLAGTMAHMMLGERPAPRLFFAAVLIFMGLGLATLPERLPGRPLLSAGRN